VGKNHFLAGDNTHIDGRVQLTDSERKALAALGAMLGKKVLADMATVATPDTIQAWNRKFSQQQADSSQPPKSRGRPRVAQEIEDKASRATPYLYSHAIEGNNLVPQPWARWCAYWQCVLVQYGMLPFNAHAMLVRSEGSMTARPPRYGGRRERL
jgi:hypothetical protein